MKNERRSLASYSTNVRDGRIQGWYWSDMEVYNKYAKNLGTVAFSVYHALLAHANKDTNRTFVGQSTIAKKLGISRQIVNRSIGKLKNKGLIDVEYSDNGYTHTYVILDLH